MKGAHHKAIQNCLSGSAAYDDHCWTKRIGLPVSDSSEWFIELIIKDIVMIAAFSADAAAAAAASASTCNKVVSLLRIRNATDNAHHRIDANYRNHTSRTKGCARHSHACAWAMYPCPCLLVNQPFFAQ